MNSAYSFLLRRYHLSAHSQGWKAGRSAVPGLVLSVSLLLSQFLTLKRSRSDIAFLREELVRRHLLRLTRAHSAMATAKPTAARILLIAEPPAAAAPCVASRHGGVRRSGAGIPQLPPADTAPVSCGCQWSQRGVEWGQLQDLRRPDELLSAVGFRVYVLPLP